MSWTGTQGEISWATVIRQAIQTRLDNFHVCIPAIVETYDPAEKRASVRPTVRAMLDSGQVLDPPIIDRVPVVMPRVKVQGQACGIWFPIPRGCPGLIHFTDRSLEEWLGTTGTANPGDPRTHNITDAIFVPGLDQFASASGLHPDNSSSGLTYGDYGIIATAAGVTCGSPSGGRLRTTASTVALGTSAGELLDLVVQALDQVASGFCSNGAPLSTASQIAALSAQINAIRGSL